jgi:hypothetical protein
MNKERIEWIRGALEELEINNPLPENAAYVEELHTELEQLLKGE